jgi:hypothetical protein
MCQPADSQFNDAELEEKGDIVAHLEIFERLQQLLETTTAPVHEGDLIFKLFFSAHEQGNPRNFDRLLL